MRSGRKLAAKRGERPRMHKIRKHARAETDLIEIWLYTYEQWGEAEAERP